MTTSFAQLDVKTITTHKHNPRHSAKADDEMVASVKEHGLIQPLIVAPAGDGYVLIAGHRRLDALKKARVKEAPAVVRTDLDTDAKQVEQMVIENMHRQDLTAIEEAEAYEQLKLFGYTQKRIAAATGRSATTVQARFKLLKLAKPTRDKVHNGQLSLDDALAITEFADDPKVVKQLEKSAGGYNFKYDIERARRDRKAARAIATTVADLEVRGIPETKLPKSAQGWNVFADVDGVVKISSTPLPEPEQHDGCLTYAVTSRSQYSGPELVYGCTHETAHSGEMSDETRAIREENERQDRERRERAAAHEAARAVRLSTILDAGVVAFPPALCTVIRALLPSALDMVRYDGLSTYQDALGIPEPDRWPSGATEANKKRAAHLEWVDGCGDVDVTRVLLALLISPAERNLTGTYQRDDVAARRHLELLEALGHPFCDVDEEIRKALDGDADAATDDGDS